MLRSVSAQGPLDPVSEVHSVFSSRDLSYTSGVNQGQQHSIVCLGNVKISFVSNSEEDVSCLVLGFLVRRSLSLSAQMEKVH